MSAVAASTQTTAHQAPAPGTLELGIGLFAIIHIGLAVFMAADPHGFYTAIGPFEAFNQHYIRDTATFYAALGFGLAVALRRPAWRVPVLATTAVQYALHSVNHLLDLGKAHPAWLGWFDLLSLAAATLLLVWLARAATMADARAAPSPHSLAPRRLPVTRIEGVPHSKAGPLLRIVYRMARRKARQIAGGRDLRLEPIEIYARVPRLLIGYGMLEQSVAARPRVEEHLRALAVLKSAVMQGCEFCQDISSHEARRASVSDGQLRELHRYSDSDQFDETERLVLDLAVGMTKTPVQVSDELFTALRRRFDDTQLVELVNLIALENLRSRFNATFRIGAAGFSDGQACARMEGPAAEPERVLA